MGPVEVPRSAFYGAQTQRAAENASLSGLRMPVRFIRSLALIKKYAAAVNRELGLLAPDTANPIIRAADEVLAGQHDDQFVVDVFQTGSGTSTNMNMNEVLAGRANEIITGTRGGKSPVHPNDHVNKGQSSNDVIPSALHLSTLCALQELLLPSLKLLQQSFAHKAEEFRDIVKTGRTHLQDALPVRLGQEFGGYAFQISSAAGGIDNARKHLSVLALGGTAVGTGANTHPEFAGRVTALLAEDTGCPLSVTKNHFAAQGSQDAAVGLSARLKTCAVALSKTAADIRLLACGPRCGLQEITLPALQPGSSIMPGKINPVIPEAVLQAAAQVIGNDAAITQGGLGGQLELNTMLPLIVHNLLQSIELLSSAARVFAQKCVSGITANKERCSELVDKSIALAAYLVPVLGHDAAAEIAREAHRTGKTIRETVLEKSLLSPEQLDELFDCLL